MGAPIKKGLDYFPFSVDLLNDIKLRKPKMKYGYLATMIYISLLSILYKDKGYYIDYRNKDDIIWQVLNDLQGKYQPTQETVADVIDDLVACELFSGDLYQSRIITSLRSQITYYKVTVDRKTVDINDDYWLLDLETMKSLSAKHCYYLKIVNRENNEVNRSINSENRPINPESKVKESKVKESKVNCDNKNNNDLDCGDNITLGDLYQKYSNIKGREISPIEKKIINDFAKTYNIINLNRAIEKAVSYKKTELAYIEAILKNDGTDKKNTKSSIKGENNKTDFNEVMEVF